MGRSSILGGERSPAPPPGHDTDALGPSDSSDSGSDIQGQRSVDPHSDSDAAGTGERLSAPGDEGVEDASDILPDHIETIAPDTAEDATASSRTVHRRSADLANDDDDSGDAADYEVP